MKITTDGHRIEMWVGLAAQIGVRVLTDGEHFDTEAVGLTPELKLAAENGAREQARADPERFEQLRRQLR